MQQSTTTRWSGAIVLAGAGLMVGASTALGTYYGYQLGAAYGTVLALAFAGAALGGELLKPFAVGAAISALGRLNLLRAAACTAVAAVCIVYSLASELALSAVSRGDAAAERSAASTQAGDARADRARITAELASLKPSRPLTELQPLVDTAKTSCTEVQDMRSRRMVCTKPPALLAEHGRAKRRAELEEQLAVVAASTVAGMVVKEADPLAASLATYAAAAGYTVEVKTLSTWLYLVPVLFLEVGSAFALVVAREFGSPATSGRTVRFALRRLLARFPNRVKVPKPAEPFAPAEPLAPAEPEPVVEPTEPETKAPEQKVAKPRRPKLSKRPAAKLQAERYVVTQLALGRKLPSQNALCQRYKVGKVTAHEWVKEWKDRGLVATSREGRCNVISKGKRFAKA